MSMECWSDDCMFLLATRMGVRSRSCSFHDSKARFATPKVRRVWFVNGTACCRYPYEGQQSELVVKMV
jgi:hypothetical protein